MTVKHVSVVARRSIPAGVVSGYDPTPPKLETLNQPPSWCNARGGVDRSACVEITIAEARELAGCVPHKTRTRSRSGQAAINTARRRADRRRGDRGQFAPANDGLTAKQRRDKASRERRLHVDNGDEPSVHPLPHERPMVNGRGRVAAGVITISARQVNALHMQRMPRTLAGDYRTARAPAMRDKHARRGRNSRARFRCRVTRGKPIADMRSLDGNPNKGASRSKIIGLPADWSQSIAVEKWIYPTRIAPTYYFACPSLTHPGYPATISTRKCGREHPRTGKCPQRCRKLMMVQCTQAERRDANLAMTWLASVPADATRLPRVRQAAAMLINRYGLIFDPRLLLCPRCLGGGVKYGNDPEVVRRSWRLANGLEDMSPRRGDLARVSASLEPLSVHARTALDEMRASRTHN